MTSNKIFLYTFFAIIATFSNLTTQRFIISFSQSNLFFLIAIFCGTVVGLLIKFFLDKKWIFFDKTSGLILQSRKFSKYSLMGILPTLIFWSTETIFWFLWNTENMREIGASIGLSIGYIIKYKLDKRFVFNK
tara:strand:+ start:2364 stop:2762 length:399 start_codon:yes stop_codon:yes gene_type:complete